MDFAPDLKTFKFLYVDIPEGKERIFEELSQVSDVVNGIDEFRKLNMALVKLFAEMTGMDIPIPT
jgi:hypothetical protein